MRLIGRAAWNALCSVGYSDYINSYRLYSTETQNVELGEEDSASYESERIRALWEEIRHSESQSESEHESTLNPGCYTDLLNSFITQNIEMGEQDLTADCVTQANTHENDTTITVSEENPQRESAKESESEDEGDFQSATENEDESTLNPFCHTGDINTDICRLNPTVTQNIEMGEQDLAADCVTQANTHENDTTITVSEENPQRESTKESESEDEEDFQSDNESTAFKLVNSEFLCESPKEGDESEDEEEGDRSSSISEISCITESEDSFVVVFGSDEEQLACESEKGTVSENQSEDVDDNSFSMVSYVNKGQKRFAIFEDENEYEILISSPKRVSNFGYSMVLVIIINFYVVQ